MSDPVRQITPWNGIPPGDTPGAGPAWHMLRPREGGEPFPALWPHDWARTRWRVPAEGLDMVAVLPADVAADYEYLGRCEVHVP